MSSEAKDQGGTNLGERQAGGGRQRSSDGSGTRSSLSSAVLKHQLQQAAKEAEEEGGRRTSFLEIQQEQARDAERKRQGSNSRLSAASRDDVDFFGRPLANQDDDGERGANNRRREGSFRRGDSFGGGARNDSYRRRSSSLNLGELPLESGRVATKLEKFGFIYCADRPSELFFHYSEFRGSNVEDLKVGDEVEFRVGPSSRRSGSDEAEDGEEKMAAYAVKLLDPGTVVWEVPDDGSGVRRKGRLQRVARDDNRQGKSNNSKDQQEGTIRLITDEDAATDDAENEADEAAKNLVRYVSSDYTTATKSGDSGRAFDRLGKNDVVEFKLVTEKRTGRKFARDITLVQSERERLRQEREDRLMETAILEQGVVSNLKEDYGFLRSNKRKHQEVYFHFSNVIGASTGGDAPVDESKKGNVDHWKKELVIGQEVEFLVLKEEQNNDSRGGGGKGGRGPTEKLSARQLKLLPKGTVLFHQVVANAVEGIIIDCPGPPAPDRNAARDGFRRDGKFKLISPLSHSCPGKDTVEITEVWCDSDSLPATNSVAAGVAAKADGGGPRHFMWLRPGDRVLFDVILSLADEKYWAVPTKGVGGQKGGDKANSEKNTETRIRLLEPNVAGRCEGVVRALHDNYGYGFIRSAERNVDVYFRMQDVFPPDIMTDIALSMGEAKKELHHYRKPIAKNMEVSFDLSLQGTVQSGGNHGSGGRTNRNQKQGERENLIGHRVAILPKGSVLQNKVLASEVKAKVSQDGKHIEVEEGVICMDMREKHPMVAKLIDTVLSSSVDSSVVLPDVQSDHEYRVIRAMVDAEDGVEWSYVPVAASSHGKSHPGKIKITRVEKGGKDSGEAVDEDSTPTDSAHAAEGDVEGANKKGKKKKKGPQTVKVIRIEKQSLSSVEGAPLKEGDVIICEVLQSRRSSDVYANVISVVERNAIDSLGDGAASAEGGDRPKELPTKGVGIVVDLLTNRQFGFISRIDEHSPKREHLFFHMSSLLEQGDVGKDNGLPQIKKSDEVSFDIALGKNGKRVAENIKILPKGTLSLGSKGSKHSCQGYLLLEPSHTTLDTTPKKKSGMRSRSKSPVGRWGLVGTEKDDSGIPESTVNEGGCILLLSDPKNIFGERTKRPSPEDSSKDAMSEAAADEKKEAGAEEDSGSEGKVEKKDDSEVSNEDDKDKNSAGGKDDLKDEESKDEDVPEKGGDDVKSAVGSYLGYKQNNETSKRGGAEFEVSEPRRGDLVSFVKGKNAKTAKDLHVIAHNAATKVLGHLENINVDEGIAIFVPSNQSYEKQEIQLVDVVSCKPKMLKDKEPVEAIMYEGKMRGIARTIDLYLESKVEKHGQKERPKLNLAMKSDRPRGPGTKGAGHVIMAKGPDGTNGFQKGWCQRKSKFAKGENTQSDKSQETAKQSTD